MIGHDLSQHDALVAAAITGGFGRFPKQSPYLGKIDSSRSSAGRSRCTSNGVIAEIGTDAVGAADRGEYRQGSR
jgi:hypothetical protein